MAQVERESFEDRGVEVFDGVGIAQIDPGILRFQVGRGAGLANDPTTLNPAACQRD